MIFQTSMQFLKIIYKNVVMLTEIEIVFKVWITS